jgi:Zn2+/Cd2+-exporting ATPase
MAGYLKRYKTVLTSRPFIMTATTAILVVSSAVVGLFRGLSLAATVLALVAIVTGGLPIVIGAIQGIFRREMNVDELVAIAIIASVLFKEYLSAGFVAFMMLFGKILEDFTAERARTALGDLGKLTPATVCVHRDGMESTIPLEEVTIGDVVITKSGERIAVDGVVISGQASVNQAPITGESIPVAKAKGNEVYAGTLNELGAIEIRATKVGESTTLARIVDLVEEAGGNRAPVVRTADRYAKYFTPLILVISAVVYIITRNLTSALAVLIVACPCALVMATPIAIIAGVANGARRGILIKGGARLEAAGRVTAVAMDKTGTITMGEPRVVRITAFDGITDREVLTMAAVAERLSEHPLGKAILKKAAEMNLNIPGAEEFQVIPGQGAIVRLNGSLIIVGTEKLLQEQNVTLPSSGPFDINSMEQEGLTPFMVALSGKAIGIIGVADTVRKDMGLAINHLKRSGVRRVLMLTGDSPEVAKRIATSVGIDKWQARLLPIQKVEAIKKLQDEGYKVAMVGDGINDAPALAQADVGVAMGISGTDVAMDTADIVLMKDDVLKAAEALNLSRYTLRTIKQNLAFALVFNLVGIGAAASGILSPIGAALFHNIGSVAVVVNSARLVGRRNISTD